MRHYWYEEKIYTYTVLRRIFNNSQIPSCGSFLPRSTKELVFEQDLKFLGDIEKPSVYCSPLRGGRGGRGGGTLAMLDKK